MDEVDLDEFLREAANAIDDPEKMNLYIREKATIAVERFLVCLPFSDILKYKFFQTTNFICFIELFTKNVNSY